jgi:SAM-dependent methyltransferase
MSPIGSHLALDERLAAPERAYLRLFGAPEPGLRVRTAHVVREVARLAPTLVVDVGAGAGFVSIAIAQRLPAVAVVAVDPAAPQVDLGRRLADAAGARVSFVAAAAAEYEPPGPVDAVVCVDALEYVEDDAAALQRITSWLRPGGSLVLHCRNAPASYRLRRFVRAPFDRDGRLRAGYGRADLTALLVAAGLTVTRVRTTMTAPAELAFELLEPELGPLRGRALRAVAAPPLLALAQFDRLGLGRGAGLLVVAGRR